MKTLIAATALSLIAGAAFAGEGNGNPYPFTAPPLSVSMQGYTQAPGVSQNPYPFAAPGVAEANTAVLPTNGSAGVMQTANSLPVSLTQPALGSTQLAQPGAPLPDTRG